VLRYVALIRIFFPFISMGLIFITQCIVAYTIHTHTHIHTHIYTRNPYENISVLLHAYRLCKPDKLLMVYDIIQSVVFFVSLSLVILSPRKTVSAGAVRDRFRFQEHY
jgi:hypothetical protein